MVANDSIKEEHLASRGGDKGRGKCEVKNKSKVKIKAARHTLGRIVSREQGNKEYTEDNAKPTNITKANIQKIKLSRG